MPRLVQFGAGNIGRSLSGALFSAAGYEVVFVDVDERLVEALNRQGSYRVVVKDEKPDEIVVSGIRAVDAADVDGVAKEIAGADIAATAVGPRAFKAVAGLLAKGLIRRGGRPLDVILCENLHDAARVFRGYLDEALAPRDPSAFPVGLIETSIGKMVPIMPDEVRRADPTVVWAEAYNQIIADRDGFINPIPDVPGLVTRGNFGAYVERKLFVHNLGHAACAYLGFLEGAHFIWEAMGKEEPAAVASGSMNESGRALQLKYPGEWSEAEMEEHVQDLLRRFRNRALGDTVHRVGRDLPRKLAPQDRLVGALRLHVEYGIEPGNTIRAAAAALLFCAPDQHGDLFPQDAEFAQFIGEKGPASALERYGGLDVHGVDKALAGRILDEYERLGGSSSRKP